MNWKELPDELFGYWRSGSDYTHIDAMLVPCASTEDKACIQDKLEVKEYLGELWNMIVYHNQFRFKADGYRDKSVVKSSVFTRVRTANALAISA